MGSDAMIFVFFNVDFYQMTFNKWTSPKNIFQLIIHSLFSPCGIMKVIFIKREPIVIIIKPVKMEIN